MATPRHKISRDDLARGGRIAAANRRARARDARLAELDARYERLVDAIAASMTIDPAGLNGDQRFRNLGAGRARRRGLAPVRTARAELRDYAETRLLGMLNATPSDPTCEAILAEIAEAFELRQARDADRDSLHPLEDGPRYVAPFVRKEAA